MSNSEGACFFLDSLCNFKSSRGSGCKSSNILRQIQIPREELEPWDNMKGQSVQWSVAIVLSLWSLANAVPQSAPIVLDITPYHGSINGATRLTIKGHGFLGERPFDYTGGSGELGNKVQLLSESRSIPCDVEKDFSHSTQIICYTRPLPKDSYQVVVSVDGVLINSIKMLIFKSERHYTPTIEKISPSSGLPGQLINISGNIFTDIYGSNKPVDSNRRSTRILRVYAGGMLCELLHPESDMFYGLKLDNMYSDSGTMTCKMTGTYVGHHNVSFILDNGHGRSLPNPSTYFISSLNKLSMFQTYAEVTGIYPSEGSVEGGTLLTVTGRFFDETDAPARVTVGGQSCEVLSVNATQIICQTPKEASHLTTVFPGGRGLKIETWQGGNLDDLPDYNENTPGYSVSWTDDALYKPSTSWSPSVTRLSGFFVAPETDNYQFYVKESGSFRLYFSLSGIPQDKVNIAYQSQNLRRAGNQEFNTMPLQKGKEYYIELVLQDTTRSSFSICMYRESISYTKQQTADSVREAQLIKSRSETLHEKQMLTLENWNMGNAVNEIQEIIISSSCKKIGTCSYIWYRLMYNQERTVLIPMGATAAKIQQALNDLWTIKPDKVHVSSKSTINGCIYKVTFTSTRGDFDLLQYEILSGNNVTIKVVERTKGKPRMDTFTLMLGGINSRPISHTASVTEVKAALEGMLDVKCPDHVVNYRKGFKVYYFNNFEDDLSQNTFQSGQVTRKTNAFCGRYCVKNPISLFGFANYHQPFSLRIYKELCFAYKGHLRNNLRLLFTYKIDGETNTKDIWFQYSFAQDDQWTYTCINLYELIITRFPRGRNVLLKGIYLQAAGDQDFFVDTVYIGQKATLKRQDDIPMVAYPPLFDKGILIEDIIVTEGGTKNAGVHSQYEVTMVTIDCGCNIPLLEIAFAQPLANNTKDEIVYRGSTWPEGAILRVQRTQAASSPISGTFDIQFFGKTLKDLPVNVTALEMQYALETIPQMGTVSVMKTGNCSAAQWTVRWLSKPGNQPKLKINGVNVIGVNATVKVYNKQRGGLFSEHLMGDLFRTPHTQPQVEVFINGIPSNCSGNCGYEWSAEKTPAISHITPTTGSRTGGTVLTITGFRFANSSMTDTTWVSIGGTHCPITGLTDTEITCAIGAASNTSSPLIVYIAGLGFANYSSNQAYTFTFQFETTSVYPSAGSTEGGTILTISGYGFVPNSTVLIGGKTCLELTEGPVKMTCSTPPAPVGKYNISVIAAGISNPVPFSFIYIDAKIPVISEVIPRTSSVSGGSNLTIYGSDFGNKSEDSFVVIGNSECAILRWSTTNIMCRLPSLPPANYSIYVQTHVGKSLSASIEYILRVTEVTPQQGSLYGSTKITISGSGFSPVLEDNVVQIGSVPCHINFASTNMLECVTGQTGRKFVIDNNGSSQTFGVGFKWNPSNLDIFVGDTVQWQWKGPSLLQNLKYRVFSVSKPSDVNYQGSGFISGNVSTTSGSFSHHFTSPGTYYYSSGYVDQKQSITLQGVVNVKPTEESIKSVHVYLAGIEAEYVPGPSEKLHSQLKSNNDCTARKPTCNQALNKADERSFTFHLSLCCSPTINSIAPSKGTMKDRLTITGTGFSNISCANEVRVGAHRCVVENSTESELLCRIDPEGVMDVGVAALVSVTIQNLGAAINPLADEMSRRFVLLPHIDAVNPNVGSTMGKTRVTITGSGFGADLDAVTVHLANVFCMVVSANYTHVICDSSASIVSNGIVTLSIRGIPAVCSGACDYSYAENAAPIVLNVSSMFLTTVYTQLTVSGSGFGNRVEEAFILIGDASFVPSDVSDSSMNCTVGPIPVGKHTLRVLTLNKGLSLRGIPITNAARASLSPASGGIHGGTTLLITGNGFVQDETTVTVHGSPCHLLSVTPGEVKCIIPAGPPGTVDVRIIVHSTMYPVLKFTYNQRKTPKIQAVSPATGVSESTITIVGSGFGSAATDITVFIGNVLCNVTLMNESCVQCIVGHHAGGIFPIFLKNKRWGYASTDFSFQYELNITSISPTKGGFGGGTLLTIRGIGFDQQKSQVFVCDGECRKVPSASTSSNLYCQVPLHNGTDPQLACEVVVVNGNVSSKVHNGFTYSLALTPVITTISPRRGGTGGGTKLTITGSGFSSDISENKVTIAESTCDIQSVNETHIVCVTSAHFPSQQTKVIVSVQENGIAQLDNADFYYIDVWSSRYTWGGDTPPETGSLVVITKGQTVLLDQSTPVLKMLVIQGGTLLFDDADIELQTENILILDGGVFQIGTESSPFRHKAIITLHGHLRAKELPLYGAKTLAVREGTLDLHGLPVPVTWTHLAQTAEAGSSTLILQKPVTWRPGDKIVIASTGDRHSQRENEDRIIEAVSDDGRTLNLTEPLTYQHLGVSIRLPDGVVFEARAEVGLLTRNIVIRGSNHVEWNDQIEACPDGFDTGEFATQTCLQGRFGEEIGSDQFGGCIMFHNPQPSKDLVVGRIEYVEIYYAGQAFRLGRYPIHWHLMGDLRYESYVRGCAIHQTFNRAVTIHGTHHLLVEGNVAYSIMGGAFFIEDGIEQGNVLQYNLVVMVQQSTSLLNDDLTPAAFWVTNPSNTIRHNAAAGGTHFGFWYRLLEHPDGPSYTPDVCPRNVPLGQFLNNTVHSQGWFGLWIFRTYHPLKGGQCNSLISEPARFDSLIAWNCEKGAEWVNGGAVQFHNFVMVNNEKAGIDTKKIMRSFVNEWGETMGAVIKNTTIVGHTDGLRFNSTNCTSKGIALPLYEGLTVLSVKFVNFDRPTCTALGLSELKELKSLLVQGWNVRFSGIKYFNTTHKGAFSSESDVVLHDLDGSLTGNPGNKVLPHSSLLDPARCRPSVEWSHGYPGVVCDASVTIHRLTLSEPSPLALKENKLILSNSHGTSFIPYWSMQGINNGHWLALIPNDEILNWHFKDMDHLTNISYKAKFHHFKDNDSIVMSHKFVQQPNHFKIMNSVRNNSLQPLTWASNQNGDWYFDQDNLTLYYLISGRRISDQHSFHSNLDPTMVDIDVQFQVFRCFYKNCEPPPRQPEINDSYYVAWSNSSFWESRLESNHTVPTEGSSVLIEQGIWMVVDSPIPPLYNLTILGTLEIRDDNLVSVNRSSPYTRIILNATYISIQGGRLIAGSPEKPFQGELQIVLRGDHSTPEWPFENGPNQGSKVLGVFGGLDLHGIPHLAYKTKLGSTAHAGSLNITLAEAVDWQEGDEILVSTTSYNHMQTEIRRIHSISFDRKTLGLNEALSYTHIAETQELKESGQRYTLAADIGLLSRNIKIIGHHLPDKANEMFGARVLISSYSHNGVELKGHARIQDVEFYHSGQYGYLSYFDPRYSVSFLNLGEIVENDSYIRGCAFHQGFAPAIGVFETSGLDIDDNVICKSSDGGIILMGDRNRARRNLVALSLWSSNSNSWTAAIEVAQGTNVVLQENIVAGFEKAGYRINGEPCPEQSNPVDAWFNNEAHGGQFGIYMNKDGFPTCSLIQGFTIWKCWEFGIYFQTERSVQVFNVTLVENKLSIFSMVYGSLASVPEISNKSILISNALLVGISPTFNCSELQPDDSTLSETKAKQNFRKASVGRNGICWPTFASASNNAPKMPHDSLTTYPAISGRMIVEKTTFVGFKGTCSNELNVMFVTSQMNEDFQHPILVKGITIVDSEEQGKAFIHRPNLGKVNFADCVDMTCDAKKKTLLKDLDGSFLGAVGAVVPQSEYEWDGDLRYGTGDYRIPKSMLTYLNGSRIPVSQIAPHKGIIRDSTCTYMPDWQSYKCFGLNYEILVIESLDPDSETRRLSPVALLSEGYVDLINGPQDHGWCSTYACNKRASIFYAVVATNKSYELYFTSISPQNLRLMLLNTDDSKVIRLAIYFSTSQRLDVYVNSTFVPPTNVKWNTDNTDFTLKGPTYTGEFIPKLDSSVIGENYFDRTYQMLNVLVKGSTPIEVHTAPVLHISFSLPAMTVDEFYGPNLVENLALFLNVPRSKIRITNIVRETRLRRKRATGITVEVEIRDPPLQHFSEDSSNSTNTTSTEGKLQFSDLKEISSNLGEAMLTGNLSASLGFTISTIDLSSPVPPPGDTQWVQMTSKPVLSREVRTNHMATMTGLIVVREPAAGQTGQTLSQQPCVKAVDDAGNCVSVGVTTWELVAVLLNSQNMTVSGLNGTTSILFEGCWANYTDLSINTNGTSYKLLFKLKSIKTHSGIFSVKQINDSPGKPSGASPASVFGNTEGIISGSVVGSIVFILLVAGITWKLIAGNKKIQVSTRPDAQDKKQVDTVTGCKLDKSLCRVQN
ncbi:PKHD1 like 1, tandem duplicate 1 isoform X2 [Stegostoma tigrinum]|uniref:PKHD1 like 1, tandem duplicate 1 isoform X2 n=1 Tax=Stegostoma tigrinum TaxID=3053191 RepID=UPI0028709E5D|nr:PKHD1 like 1, tandem duplicate 1 isoform X2 [Stegostoma tigrinum]